MRVRQSPDHIKEFQWGVVQLLKRHTYVHVSEISAHLKVPEDLVLGRMRACVERKLCYRIKNGYFSLDKNAKVKPELKDKHTPAYLAGVMHQFTKGGYELRKLCDELQAVDTRTENV